MVQSNRPQRSLRRTLERRREAVELRRLDRTALLAPRPDRVEPGDCKPVGRVCGLGRTEDAFPLFARPGEACREDVRNVVVPRNREKREGETLEQLVGALELFPATPVREVARDDHDLGSQSRDQLLQRCERLGRRTSPEMQIRDVENPSVHRWRESVGRGCSDYTLCRAASRAVILVR